MSQRRHETAAVFHYGAAALRKAFGGILQADCKPLYPLELAPLDPDALLSSFTVNNAATFGFALALCSDTFIFI